MFAPTKISVGAGDRSGDLRVLAVVAFASKFLHIVIALYRILDWVCLQQRGYSTSYNMYNVYQIVDIHVTTSIVNSC